MNWEGQIMKSTRLSFNTAIARNIRKRFWPLWAAYFCYLIVSFPVYLFGATQRMLASVSISAPAGYLGRIILGNAVDQIHFNIFTAILAAMFLFGYLCNSRGNTLMNMLPVRRNSMFLTVYLTGLLPTIGCQILAMLAAIPVCAGHGLPGQYYLLWLASTAMSFIAFYGFSVFCAMLTGNILIIPAVYFALNLAAAVYEACLRSCLTYLVYGMTNSGAKFLWLSPIAYVFDKIHVEGDWTRDISRIHGFGMLVVYCACGLLFALLALLLYRKRKMEAVSDFVAVPVLRPIFRACMGFGTAVVFAAFLFSSFLGDIIVGKPAAVLMGILLLAGAFLGWIAAEMMIRRSLRIFPLPWKGLAAVCAVCVLTVLIAETDMTGYERRIPDPDQVQKVSFIYDTQLEEPENIRTLTELHREIIDNKRLYDGTQNRRSAALPEPVPDGKDVDRQVREEDTIFQFWVPIRYQLKNGRTIQRSYMIYGQTGDVDRPDTTIGRLRALLNIREGILSRMAADVPVVEENIRYAAIHVEETDGINQEYRLTPKQAAELWRTAILPDGEDQKICLYTICDTEENLKTQTNLTIYIETQREEPDGETRYWGHEFRVFTFSQRCLEWIEENTDLSWTSLSELYAVPGGVESDLQ